MLPIHGHDKDFGKIIQNFLRINSPDGYRINIFIIENNTKQTYKSEFEKHCDNSKHNFHYIFVPFTNKSKSLNSVLVRFSDQDFVFFTDDDVYHDPNLILSYFKSIKEHGQGHFFGGAMDVKYQKEPEKWLRKYLPTSALGWRYDPNSSEELKYFFGCNWGAFISDINKAGEFNVELGPGATSGASGQETEMQSRLMRLGVRPVYVDKAVVVHDVPSEKCTYQWALNRKKRDGIYFGMKDHFLDVSRDFFGYPIAIMKELLVRLPKYILFKLFYTKKSSAYFIFDFHFRYGKMIGHRYRRKHLLNNE